MPEAKPRSSTRHDGSIVVLIQGVYDRLDNVRTEMSGLKSSMGALELRERERNGNMNKMFEKQAEEATKVADLQLSAHDASIRSAIYRAQGAIIGATIPIIVLVAKVTGWI